jgi:hypothetical protein
MKKKKKTNGWEEAEEEEEKEEGVELVHDDRPKSVGRARAGSDEEQWNTCGR